jgi:hypothetical protein
MTRQANDQDAAWQAGALMVLRVAPWVVFGPITGFFTEWAWRMLRAGRPVRAVLLVCANIAVVASIPLLTAVIAAHNLSALR